MAKGFKVGVVVLLFAVLTIGCAPKQSLTVDMRVNVLAADEGNYFNWTSGALSVKDKFDAASGASLSKSTEAFNAVRYDGAETKKATMPGGLRSFFLYGVSNFDIIIIDAVTVTTSGKQVTIRYAHRNAAFELVTDENGKFDVLTGAKRAVIADSVDGKFIIKPELVKEGTDPAVLANLDWTKVTLTPDVKSADATRWYEGTLDIAYADGIVTIKGGLMEKAK